MERVECVEVRGQVRGDRGRQVKDNRALDWVGGHLGHLLKIEIPRSSLLSQILRKEGPQLYFQGTLSHSFQH